MGLGMSLCLSQVATCRQEVRLDTADSCLRTTDLPRSAKVLRAASSERLREALEAFVSEHWHDRAILDYVLGILVPPSRAPMLRFYDEDGPSLRELSPREDIRKLDGAVADALRGLRLAFDEVERQAGAPALETWHLTCGAVGLESDWFSPHSSRVVPAPVATGDGSLSGVLELPGRDPSN